MSVEIRVSDELTTDGDTVYLGGMDLANILRASLPSRDSRKYEGKTFFGRTTVTVRVEAQDFSAIRDD